MNVAKQYKQQSIVSGLSVNDILNMDIDAFNSLSLRELQNVTGRLVSAGNKRLRTFAKYGETSPATRYVMQSGGQFSTKGKNLNQLRAEFVRAKGFFQAQTSTLKDWKKIQSQTLNSLKNMGIDVNKNRFGDMWKAYEQLKESNPEVASRGLKYRALKEIASRLRDRRRTPSSIARQLKKDVSKIYESEQEMISNATTISDFFETTDDMPF